MRYLLITVVAVVHVTVIGGALLIQGCGTTRGPVTLPTEHPMPPAMAEEELPPPAPVSQPYRPTTVQEDVTAAMPAASTQKHSTPVPVSEETKSYVVGKGDSLSVIAKRHGVSQADIMLLNNIKDPNKVRIGQKLKLPASAHYVKPASARPAAVSPAASPAVVSGTGAAGSYKVKAGDSLSVIAHRYGTTTKALQEANGLKDTKIIVGQTLVLPTGSSLKTVAPVRPEPTLPPVTSSPSQEITPPAPDLPLPSLSPDLPPVAAGSRTTYTVKVGDDILSVASDFNVSISELRRANSLTSDTLVPGRTLVIPASN